jgi:alginate O-acetyltransferase complex protein AlgI
MLFSEPIFFAFFAVYFVLHLLIPLQRRLWLVIGGSTVFYAWWRPIYVELPYLLTLIAWAGTIWLDLAETPAASAPCRDTRFDFLAVADREVCLFP